MFQRMRYLIGLTPKRPPSRRLLNAGTREVQFQPPDVLETVHEIAIYIHRFHNLDLFQQGWYQIKISARWEDNSQESCGSPSRVIQYEALSVVSDDVLGVWRIDDADHSFTTQPFKIKYARQDVPLSIMVSFNFHMGKDEKPSICAVVLKFELMYAPILENGHEIHASFDMVPVATHEFRIPPKALLGLHSYCPVHFDAFHAVLVDLSIHIVYLKAGTSTWEKLSSSVANLADEYYEGPNQMLGQRWSSKAIEIVKSLLVSRKILLEEIKNLSKAIGQNVDDLQDADINLGRFEPVISSLRNSLSSPNGISTGMPHSILQKRNGTDDLGNDAVLYSLSKKELLDEFFTLGKHLSFLWNTFLKFHRLNRISILEYLHGVWAMDRKADWSIWMVHSKIDVPHRYLRSGADDPSRYNSIGKATGVKKSNDEPAQSASTCAELHRKTIAQMKINSCSIQDKHIFGDPSRVPVILVEQHAINLPNDSSWHSLDQDDSAIPSTPGKIVVPKFSQEPKRSGRVLRAVVFVHGFQGHHLDLRLVRNQWLLLDPAAECLMSEANEEKTTGDFREMGGRLAEEVVTFLRKKIDKLSKYGGCKDIKLSFVGHSIGNIIIRSALTENIMAPFLKHLHTYMSISGAHLGYWYSSNSLFNSGLWLMKKLKGAQCFHQLTFTDDPDLQNTFFYKLCKKKTLENFKNIILLSSPQDGYVPYHSARIELCQASSWDQSKKAHVFMEMLNNCLDQIRAPSSQKRVFMRCDVNFDTSSQGRNLNTFIGRAAHIEFLETDIFAKFIMWSFQEYFR